MWSYYFKLQLSWSVIGKLAKLRTLALGSTVGTGMGCGSIFQMSRQYSLMVRSLENLLDLATPMIAILFQRRVSR
jgi:hypothetical protein